MTYLTPWLSEEDILKIAGPLDLEEGVGGEGSNQGEGNTHAYHQHLPHPNTQIMVSKAGYRRAVVLSRGYVVGLVKDHQAGGG